jgi:hypothetical protein
MSKESKRRKKAERNRAERKDERKAERKAERKRDKRKAEGKKAKRAGPDQRGPDSQPEMSQQQVKEPVMGSANPQRPVLRSLSDIYRYFRENTTPIYFISPTPYNLLGIDEWVGGFRYITYFDSFDGAHARSFSPAHAGPRDFESF